MAAAVYTSGTANRPRSLTAEAAPIGGGGQALRRGHQQRRRQHAAHAEAGERPAVGGEGQTQTQQEQRLPAARRRGIGVRQRRQQRCRSVQHGTGSGAQRPLPRLPLDEIGRLHQQRHQHGSHRPEYRTAVQAGGAERRVGTEDEDGGGGVAQPRLKIQKKESAQSRAQQGAEPGPADACGGDSRQRPWAVQAVQRRTGQQKRGGRR